MIQINFNIQGTPGADPVIWQIDDGQTFPLQADVPGRMIVVAFPPLSSPFGSSILWKGQQLARLLVPYPGFVGEATDPACAMQPPALVFQPPTLPRITIAGDQFLLNGQRWVWRMASFFRGYDRFKAGEDLTPQLTQLKSLGFTGVRTFFFVHSFGNLNPPDFSRVGEYLDFLNMHGFYCEMTSGDLQFLPMAQLAYFNSLLDIARPKTNVFFEFCNEADNNGLDHNAALQANRSGVICSLGSSTSGNPCPLPSLDYADSHLRRDISAGMYADTCPLEMQTGYPGYAGVGMKPVPHNETIGAAEYSQPGRRTNDPTVFYRLARMSSAWNGITFHSELGIDAQVLSGAQLSCAEAFAEGMAS